MRDDEMDFCLMWVRFGILEFSRGQKYTTQIAIEYANPEYQYQYGWFVSHVPVLTHCLTEVALKPFPDENLANEKTHKQFQKIYDFIDHC